MAVTFITNQTQPNPIQVGGALSGECKCGLTQFGREAAKRMKQLDIIIDLTHAHPNLMTDVLDLPTSERPALMVSHTGVNGVCKNSRNMDDMLLKRVADAGGIIGVTLFPPALCGDDLVASFVDTVKHVVKVTGNNVGAVALGSDWDGAVDVIVTAEQTDILAAALLNSGGFEEEQVSRILFDNALAFLSKSLPAAA